MNHHAARTAEADPPAIDARAVAHRFGTRWVLRGVDLRVETGSIVALTGRNGSGKTTLLRILATLLRPTRGTVDAFGRDALTRPNTVRNRLGYLAHNPGIYDDLTAAENLSFAQRMYGMSADVLQRNAVLERVGLADSGSDAVRAFSAGMRRRLALGRILLHPPTLLLLDEPYASFDADGIALINDVARETAARGGAVIIATHDMERASVVVDAQIEIQNGLVCDVGVGAHHTADAHHDASAIRSLA